MSTGIFTILNACGPLVGAVIAPLVFEGITGYDNVLDKLKNYNYVLTIISCLILTLIIIYFPENPPTPVSPTAEQPRLDYMSSFHKLSSNKNFWYIIGVTCLVIGSNQPLSCLFTTILTKHGVTQVECGYISALSGISMIISTFILS